MAIPVYGGLEIFGGTVLIGDTAKDYTVMTNSSISTNKLESTTTMSLSCDGDATITGEMHCGDNLTCQTLSVTKNLLVYNKLEACNQMLIITSDSVLIKQPLTTQASLTVNSINTKSLSVTEDVYCENIQGIKYYSGSVEITPYFIGEDAEIPETGIIFVMESNME